MSKLVSTDRIDYRYYMWIRKIWGLTSTPKARSLCPYFHTMLWGSIFCVLCSPLFISGWLFMKVERMVCKIQVPFVERFFNYMDNKTDWMDRLDNAPDNFAESPIWAGVAYTACGIVIIAIVASCFVVLAGLLGFAGWGIWNITGIAVSAFDCAAWTFSRIFLIFSWAGFALNGLYNDAIWLFSNGPLWVTIGTWAVWIVGWILFFGAAAIAICLTFMSISKTSLAKQFGNFVSNKLNGYSEAQKARRARAEEAIKKLPKWECGYCSYFNRADKTYCDSCGDRKFAKEEPKEFKESMPIAWFIYPFIPAFWLIEKVISVKDQKLFCTKDIIDPLAMLWSYIVALKKGVCPLLEFVDPKDIQERAQAAAKARMDRENEKKCD